MNYLETNVRFSGVFSKNAGNDIGESPYKWQIESLVMKRFEIINGKCVIPELNRATEEMNCLSNQQYILT